MSDKAAADAPPKTGACGISRHGRLTGTLFVTLGLVSWQRIALSLPGMAAVNAAPAIKHRPGRYRAA